MGNKKIKIIIIIFIELLLIAISSYIGFSQSKELAQSWLNLDTSISIIDLVKLALNSGEKLPLLVKLKIFGAAGAGILIALFPIIFTTFVLYGYIRQYY